MTRILGAFSAALFALFAIAGIVALVETRTTQSCAAGQIQNEPTRGAADNSPYWSMYPTGDCIGVTSAAGVSPVVGEDEGAPASTYTGEAWVYIRAATGAWIAWTTAMVLLAAAVSAIPSSIKQESP